MDSTQNIHIGSIIKKKLTEKSITIAEFARRIDRERTTVYDIFERKTIDIDLLINISNALDYDFIHEVYFPKNLNPKMLLAIEVDRSEIEKLNLPKEFIQLMKYKK
jgi:plasmid maintenance system antidote protein VapI